MSAEYQREWRKRNPNKASAYCSKWKEKNYDKYLDCLVSWRERNSEHVKQYNKEYTSKNLNRLVTYNRNKRAKYKQLDGSHTFEDIEKILIKQNFLCVGCDTFLKKYDVDHIIPQSRGGSNGPENLQCLCPSCNRSKHDKTMEEWIQHKNKRNRE